MACYELQLRAEFSAAHQLRLADGTVEPLHGHNWKVEVYLRGDSLDTTGLLADFTELQSALRTVTSALHDTCLNELEAFSSDNPSTELVAKYVHDQFAPRLPDSIKIRKIRIWETNACAAVYLP